MMNLETTVCMIFSMCLVAMIIIGMMMRSQTYAIKKSSNKDETINWYSIGYKTIFGLLVGIILTCVYCFIRFIM